MKADISNAHEYYKKAYLSLSLVSSKEALDYVRSSVLDFYRLVEEIVKDTMPLDTKDFQYNEVLFDYYCFTKQKSKANRVLRNADKRYVNIKNKKEHKELSKYLNDEWLHFAKAQFKKYFGKFV